MIVPPGVYARDGNCLDIDNGPAFPRAFIAEIYRDVRTESPRTRREGYLIVPLYNHVIPAQASQYRKYQRRNVFSFARRVPRNFFFSRSHYSRRQLCSYLRSRSPLKTRAAYGDLLRLRYRRRPR